MLQDILSLLVVLNVIVRITSAFFIMLMEFDQINFKSKTTWIAKPLVCMSTTTSLRASERVEDVMAIKAEGSRNYYF